MSSDSLRKHAFWLYGVIVGLAIRDALVVVVPKLIAPSGISSELRWLEGLRLGLFLLVVVRFYLGSAYYFDEVYDDPAKAVHYKKKNYGLDFSIGMVHFLLFYAWATTITVTSLPSIVGPSHFTNLLLVVLIYDLLWLIASKGLDSIHAMKLWAAINFVTVVLCVLLMLGAWALKAPLILIEYACYVPVVFFSLVDFMELTSGTGIFGGFLRKLSDRHPAPPPAEGKETE